MQKLDLIHQLGHYHKQLQSVENAVAAAGDDEPAAEDRFAEMSKIVIKKRAYYQENKLKVYGLLWGLCNPALVRACETHRDYPDILLRLGLLSLWRLVMRLCTIGMRDDVDVDER